jgi:tetratricopeptide (TPR) repeat protein
LEAEKKALEKTEEARKEAVANLQKAREAVDQMLTRVGDEGGVFADEEAGMAPVRRRLLEDALKFYQGFLQQGSKDPLIRAETGMAYFRVGIISVYLFADRARANDAFAQAVLLLEQAVVDFPNKPEYRKALGRSYTRRGELLQSEGRYDEAVQEHQRAVVQFQEMARLSLPPNEERWRRQELAYTYLMLGTTLEVKRPGDAERAFRDVLALAEQLDKEFPNALIYGRYLAFGSRGLANSLNAAQPENALPHYQRSAELLKRLAAQFPQHPLGRNLAWEAGDTYVSLGDLLTRLGRPAEARAAHVEAVQLFQHSAEQYEKRATEVHEGKQDYGARAARDYAKLARELLPLGRTPEAIAAGRKAIQLKPDDAEANNYLARGLATCAGSEMRDLVQAVALAKRAVELVPKQAAYWNTLGVAHYRAGNWKEAIAAQEKSMALRQGGDSWNYFFLAVAHWQLGEKEKAIEWYDKAVEWMEANANGNADLIPFRAEAEELMKKE